MNTTKVVLFHSDHNGMSEAESQYGKGLNPNTGISLCQSWRIISDSCA
jgi:hypothetical protein